jgi:hypothetical protein
MWFRWLVPSAIPMPVLVTPMTTTIVPRTRRRRSVPVPLPGSLIQPVRLATSPISSETQSSLELNVSLHQSKRVYFLAPALLNNRYEGFSRETGFTEPVLEEGESSTQPRAQLQPPIDGSPRSSLSSSSTLVSNAIHVQVNTDLVDERVVESDSSSRRSLSKRLPKIKNPFAGKARRRSANAETFSQTPPAGLYFFFHMVDDTNSSSTFYRFQRYQDYEKTKYKPWSITLSHTHARIRNSITKIFPSALWPPEFENCRSFSLNPWVIL